MIMDSDTCSATNRGGETTVITAVHPDIIQTHILTRLDGPSLASTSSASSELHRICSDEGLWKAICNSSWPSTADSRVREAISAFPAGHRSFYSDSFPALRLNQKARANFTPNSSTVHELISAVDIHFGEKLVYSKVVVTETLSGWFLCSPLRIDLLGPKESVPTSVKVDGDDDACRGRVEEHMRLSWILIDPATKRAMNVSSLTPVSVRRHWLTGDIQVKYATVMASPAGGGVAQATVIVTCEGKEGGELHVREVSMQVEDMEGKIVSGKDSLVILLGAMEGQRSKWDKKEEKRKYEMFLEMKREWRERKQRRERRLDSVCVAAGVTLFMSFWSLVLFR